MPGARPLIRALLNRLASQTSVGRSAIKELYFVETVELRRWGLKSLYSDNGIAWPMENKGF